MSSTPGIPFTKASACGNDFLIVQGENVRDEYPAITQRMCDRHNGVGADGVEWIFSDRTADVMARLFNADGSEAEISGNGTRCVAAELSSKTGKTEVTIRTGAGLKVCRLISHEGPVFQFESAMGQPVVEGPLTIETMWLKSVGTKVSMGNPHYVVFMESFPDDWKRRGALIGSQPVFPHGTNVEFVVVRGQNEIEIRLFERGVGETQSSGTGSCASAVAAIASQRVKSPVRVVAPGGPQIVRWDDQVYLTGPATLVCRGEFFI